MCGPCGLIQLFTSLHYNSKKKKSCLVQLPYIKCATALKHGQYSPAPAATQHEIP